MRVNRVGKPVRCPACGWRESVLHSIGPLAGWLKCRNPACGLTWHEDYIEVPERPARRRYEQSNQ